MKALILGRSAALVNSAARFISISNNLAMALSASELSIAQPMPNSGTVQNLYVQLSAAPGVGTKYNVTVMKNAIATAITFDIADTATTGSDTSNAVSYVAGDRITLQFTPTGTPGAPTCTWSIENVGTGHPVLTGGSGVINGSTPQYTSFQCANWNTVNTGIETLIPTAGTISNLQTLGNVNAGIAGSGNTVTVTLVRNGVDTALVASFVNATRTASDNTDIISVSPGDTVYYRLDEIGTIGTSRLFIGALFTPTIDGESIQTTSLFNNLVNNTTQYYGIGGANNTGSSTESTRNDYNGSSNFVAKKINFQLSVAPGTGKSFTAKVRSGQVDTLLSTTISDSNTTSSNTINTVNLVAGDFLDVATTPAGTPTASQPKISFVTINVLTATQPTISRMSASQTATQQTISRLQTNRSATQSTISKLANTPIAHSITTSTKSHMIKGPWERDNTSSWQIPNPDNWYQNYTS